MEKYKKLVLIMLLTLNSQSKRMRLLLMRQMALYLRSVISRNGMILFVRCNNSFVIRKKSWSGCLRNRSKKLSVMINLSWKLRLIVWLWEKVKSMVWRMGNSKNFTRLSVYSSSGKKLLLTAILKGITDIRLV